jgi:hypothetical protein
MGHGEIVSHSDGQMTFDGCTGVFHDGKKSQDGSYDDLTLYKLEDSKLITYLVTDKVSVKMKLTALDDKMHTRTINFAQLLEGKPKANKYGFCIVISRKVKGSETADYKGFNYIYFSIIDYETDTKLNEGYLTNNGIGIDEFRKLMVLNSAKIKNINPSLTSRGIIGYVEELVSSCKGE